MAHTAMVTAYLEKLLGDRFADDVEVLDDAYILPLEAGLRVRVVPGTGHGLRVEVRGLVARDLDLTTELLAALNELNLGLPYGRVYAIEDQVIVETTVEADELTPNALDNAIGFCLCAVDTHGPDLSDAFGARVAQLTLGDVDDDPGVRDAVAPIADLPAPAGPHHPAAVSAAGYL